MKRLKVGSDSDDEKAGPSGASTFSQNTALRLIRTKYRFAREMYLAKKKLAKQPAREHWWKAHVSFQPAKAFIITDSSLRKRMDEEATTLVEETIAGFQEATAEKLETWYTEVENELTEIQHSISVTLGDEDRKKWEELVKTECKELKQKIADEQQQQAPPRAEFKPTPFRPTRGFGGRGKGRGKRSH
jgi:hypothetical protein